MARGLTPLCSSARADAVRGDDRGRLPRRRRRVRRRLRGRPAAATSPTSRSCRWRVRLHGSTRSSLVRDGRSVLGRRRRRPRARRVRRRSRRHAGTASGSSRPARPLPSSRRSADPRGRTRTTSSSPAVGRRAGRRSADGSGVLGIFDAGSRGRTPVTLIADVETGIADVAARVPYDWRSLGRGLRALGPDVPRRSLDGLPGDDPQALDAVAFPVPGRSPEDGSAADTRFAAQPATCSTRARRARARLIRHELTHVAVGRARRRHPTWLSEGIAEYVSVQPLGARGRRRCRGRRSPRSEDGRGHGLPADDAFNEAGRRGRLRRRVVGVRDLVPRPRAREPVAAARRSWTARPRTRTLVLESLVGVTSGMLARRSAKMMITSTTPTSSPRTRRYAPPTSRPTRDYRFPVSTEPPPRAHRRRRARARRRRAR